MVSIKDLEHEIYGPIIIETYRKLSAEKSETDGCYILILNYKNLSFRGFESYLRILSSRDQNDFQLILKQYNSKFITYKFPPGVYTFKDLSEVLSKGFKNEFDLRKLRLNLKYDKFESNIIENDNVTLITNLILRYDIKVLRFNKKSVVKTIFGFSPYWDY